MKTQVNSQWSHAILVCKKCSKKLKGGFGPDGDEKLSKVIRKALNVKKSRKSHVGVVEVPCLDVCPKGAVMVIDTRCPGNWKIITPDQDVPGFLRDIESECAK